MADYRSQIEQARKEGYSDDEIVQFLGKTDAKVQKALAEGFSPQEVVGFLSAREPSFLEGAARKIGIAGKAAGPSALGATVGALPGVAMGNPPLAGVGALAGSLIVPTADAAVMAYNALAGRQAQLPSDMIRNYLPGPTPETAGERVLAAGSEAVLGAAPQLGAARLLAGSARPGMQALGQVVGAQPARQLAAAGAAGTVGQATTEATDNPLLGLAAGVAAGGAAGVKRPKGERIPTKQELQADYNARIQQLDKSNFQMVSKKFATEMDSRLQDLDRIGYDPELYPQVATVIRRLTDDTPRTASRLQALRTMIQDLRASASDPQRKIASRILREFDDYLDDVPKDHVVAGRPEVLQTWKESRPIYARIKKSEVFEKMLDDVQFTTQPKEKALLSSLQKLAKDESEMRTFSKSEQEAIRKAAQSGSVNQALELVAKLTPNTFATIFYTVMGGPTGAGLAAAGTTARMLAGAGRQVQVNQLADQMRLGRPPVRQRVFQDVPLMTTRGALSSPYYEGPVNALVQE